MSSEKKPYSLFEVYGIELEYMLVHKESLDIFPAADRLLKAAAGKITTDYVENNIGLANELALHLIEIRTDEPVRTLEGTDQQLQKAVQKINKSASEFGAQLMPTAMHPWMEPVSEAVLWPHQYRNIYRQFDRIYDCRRHGWSNLQSCQLNLPFSGDDEFSILHAAIRFMLPILPAIAASSPICEGSNTGFADYRLEVYKKNSSVTPMVAGKCIPEAVYTKSDYEEKILSKIFRQIKPFDPEGRLQYEWLNARGAIARFDRDAIEIRVLDMQEHPGADLAICSLIVSALQMLIHGKYRPVSELRKWPVSRLKKILDLNIRKGLKSPVEDTEYLSFFGIRKSKIKSGELWKHIHESDSGNNRHFSKITDFILSEGSLSDRIVRAAGNRPDRKKIRSVYRKLSSCLEKGKMFNA